MSKRNLLILVIFCCVAIATVSCSKEKIPEKPNIILIFTDDQQWNTINALGNKNIHTPNMDRMVEETFVF